MVPPSRTMEAGEILIMIIYQQPFTGIAISHQLFYKLSVPAEVAELADALGSGPSSRQGSAGSSPVFGTLPEKDLRRIGVSPFFCRIWSLEEAYQVDRHKKCNPGRSFGRHDGTVYYRMR